MINNLITATTTITTIIIGVSVKKIKTSHFSKNFISVIFEVSTLNNPSPLDEHSFKHLIQHLKKSSTAAASGHYTNY
jgi:hypothetical protein